MRHRDRSALGEVAELLRSQLPRVEELVIAGVGHLLHMQRPEPVVRGMAAFLDRHPTPAARQLAPLSV